MTVAVLLAVIFGMANMPMAQATPAQDYYNTLEYNGMVIWDYPLMLKQGVGVCDALYHDVNPMPLLQYAGYDTPSAAVIIISAKSALCPGNAVTS